MEEVHIRILVKKRQDIMDNIASPLDVADVLYALGILTSNQSEEVKAENVRYKQVRALLDILPMRGPNAFDAFYDALVKTDNGSAADLLKPGLQRTELPRTWIDEAEVSQPVNIKLCDIKSHLITKYWKSPDVYSMKQRIRGRCLIISNEKFCGVLPDRVGSENDVLKLTELFDQLSFEVQVYKNLSGRNMIVHLKAEAEHPSHKNAECFVLVICTRGDENGIFGTDGTLVKLDDILSLFTAQNCHYLAFKPKLVFLQVCAGCRLDEGVEKLKIEDTGFASLMEQQKEQSAAKNTLQMSDYKGNTEPHTGRGGEVEYSVYNVSAMEEEEIESIPSMADFLIVRACQPGYASFRRKQGSWFIQAVVWVFQRYAYDRDIHQLLILVNRLVAKGKASSPGPLSGKRQMPRFDSSLQKMFFFFPGVFAPEIPTESC